MAYLFYFHQEKNIILRNEMFPNLALAFRKYLSEQRDSLLKYITFPYNIECLASLN